MDEKLETTFVSIAISSSRGMLAARSAGTFFGQFIFPLVTPGDLILSKKVKATKDVVSPHSIVNKGDSKKGRKK